MQRETGTVCTKKKMRGCRYIPTVSVLTTHTAVAVREHVGKRISISILRLKLILLKRFLVVPAEPLMGALLQIVEESGVLQAVVSQRNLRQWHASCNHVFKDYLDYARLLRVAAAPPDN